ncbi:GyrI-like domain-containing protein [Paenibacillus harenae]|uniref:GyrI-like small molecule binding domain-containing protein n=1 Tax=Paenibacillus harenae TaxID=306543 RepID=A0ABT9U183_PAEHA|nr:GyrI-like domain-containing protein [Paenibacillus harenae]MDQ0112435.1 hypothetical protein [Paenibacillus harenae]
MVNDYRKIYKPVYHMKPDMIELLQVPPLQFIVQEGRGRLNTLGRPAEDYWAVWKTVNQLKRMSKERNNYQFKLMPHEIVWHEKVSEEEWTFTEMMQVPDSIDFDMYDEANRAVEKRYRKQIMPKTKLIMIDQGFCIQKLHIGHYRESYKTVEELRKYAEDHGYKVSEDRREIYLNPPDCYPTPDRWETIVRLQIKAL